MHAWLSMYVRVCVCGSMCECVLSGKYFLLLLPPAAAWGLPANILEYFYTKRQRQSDEGTDRRQTSAPPAACTTTWWRQATTDGTWPSTSKHLYSYQHNFASVDVLQCSATVSACVAASGPPCVPVSGCVCCCWRRLRTVDGCTDRISGWLVGFAQQLLF